MKQKILKKVAFFFTLFFSFAYYGAFAQTVSITQISVNNGPFNNSQISFNYQESITVTFFAQITSLPNGGTGENFNIYYQKTSNSTPTVPTGGYGENSTGKWFSIVLNASNFNESGGFIFAQFSSSIGVFRSGNIPVIKPLVPPIVNNTISSNQTIFYGQNATITGNIPSGGTGSFIYEWQYKVGSNWANIAGGQSITITPTVTTQYRRIASTYGGGTSQTNISNTVLITVNNSLPITNNNISGTQTINEGNTATILTGNPPLGGNGPGTFSYVWQKKTASTAWAPISGATSQVYAPGTPFITTNYRRLVRSGNATEIASNEITITVIPAPPISNNTITMNGANVVGSQPLGGTGQYSYIWTIFFHSGELDPIILSSTTQSIIIPGNIYNLAEGGISIYRTLNSASQTSVSNILQILPTTNIQNNIISMNGTEVVGSLPTGGSGSYEYSWTLLGAGELILLGHTGQSFILPVSIYALMESFPYLVLTRTVKSGNRTSVSNSLQIPPLSPISNNTISIVGNSLIGSQPTGGYNNEYSYQWYGYNHFNGEVVGEFFELEGNGQSNIVQIIPGLPTNYYRVVKSGPKTSNSNLVTYGSGRMISQSNKIENNLIVKMYPNPTTKSVNFETNLSTTDVEVVIYNELGRSAILFKGNLKEGQIIKWDIPSDYPKGLYFYKISSGNQELKVGKILYQ